MSAELSREEREGEERKVRKFGGEEWREWNGKRGLDLILPEATKHSPRFARVAAWKLRHDTHKTCRLFRCLQAVRLQGHKITPEVGTAHHRPSPFWV